LEKARAYGPLGADALVSLPPFFFPCSQDELFGFYEEVASAASVPLVLYDNPRLARNALTAGTIVRLAEHPNTCGVKLSAPDPQQWRDLLDAPLDRERFSLICGAGRVTSLALRLGFDGITEGLHNLIPALAVALYDAASAGEAAEAERIQNRINRCFEIFEIAGAWRGLEIALREMDIASHAAPAPYHHPPDAAARARILAVLERENIVSPVRGR
jgi:4-hydroxy-tetrahydrodipicolinate synthase